MFSLPVLVCCIHTYVDLGFLRHVQWGGRYCKSLIYQSEVSAQDLSKHNQFKLEGKSNYLHPQARVRGGVGLLAGDSVLQIPYFWFARGRQPGRSPSAPLLPRLPPPRRAPGSGVGVSRGCGHLRCAASAPAAARPNNPRLTLYPKRRKTVRASFGGRSPASCKLCLRSS